MWLDKVVIRNLFCYRNPEPFDFARPAGASSDKSVAIVWGRNGFGKTSFLTSLKLLFGGISQDLTTTIFSGLKLTPKQFVLGVGSEWSGIVNSLVLQRTRGDVVASVSATWHDTKNGQVTATREWCVTPRTNSFEETLTVHGPDGLIEHAEDAAKFLETVLPPHYLRFIMYDGEQIQELAEGDDDTRIAAMEKLLNITPIETLEETLRKAKQRWGREPDVDTVQHELSIAESDFETLERKLKKNQNEFKKLSAEQEEYEEELRSIREKLDELETSGPIEARARLVGERQQLERTIQNDLTTIFRLGFADVPFLFNEAFVQDSVQFLREQAKATTAHGQIEMIRLLRDRLPGQLFDDPPHSYPPLTEIQRRHYRGRLHKLLDAYYPEPEDAPLNLGEADRAALQSKLEEFARAKDRRRERLEALRTYLQRREMLTKINRRLDDLSELSDEHRTRVEQLRVKRKETEERLFNTKDKLVQCQGEERKFLEDIKSKGAQVTKQRNLATSSARAAIRADTVGNVMSFLDELVGAMRRGRREQIESLLNGHLQVLLRSNSLVKRVAVDDKFKLSYFTANGTPIGKRNMSAGMRQLIATALLWALKDASGYKVPVVVDTPLARLDRDHQNVLLESYFANASHQMILLPTDSEIDRDKYKLIQPHTYVEYILNNHGGNDARIELKSPYDRR